MVTPMMPWLIMLMSMKMTKKAMQKIITTITINMAMMRKKAITIKTDSTFITIIQRLPLRVIK